MAFWTESWLPLAYSVAHTLHYQTRCTPHLIDKGADLGMGSSRKKVIASVIDLHCSCGTNFQNLEIA